MVTLKKQGQKSPTITLSVTVHGTAPLQRVAVIKDFVYAYTTDSADPAIRFD
jgi:hypothetical protein